MPKLTKGTAVFMIDPEDDSVVRITKVTSLNPGSAPADNIETTDLEETDSRQYAKGLKTPSTASMTIQATPEESSHVRLHELSEDGASGVLKFAIGWSDGTEPPTVDSNGEWELPTSRTWNTFEGSVSDFPLDFQLNAVVQTNAVIQRSGGMAWHLKAQA